MRIYNHISKEHIYTPRAFKHAGPNWKDYICTIYSSVQLHATTAHSQSHTIIYLKCIYIYTL